MKASDSGKINKALILKTVWQNPGISRIELAGLLELNKSTITRVVNELLEQKILLVGAEGDAGPQGGRRPIYLDIDSAYGTVLGLGFQEDGCDGIAVDLKGNIKRSYSYKKGINPENLKEAAQIVMNELRQGEDDRILGIGMGIPGVVVGEKNIILQSFPLRIRSPFSVDWISSVPLVLENDARCCCWGELINASSEAKRNFVYVQSYFHKGMETMGTAEGFSVGLGIVLNSMVQKGAFGSSGEFRSLSWCNDSGSQFSMQPEEISQLRENRDLFISLVDELASNISLLANTMDLEQVIIGGDMARLGEDPLSLFQQELNRLNNYPDISVRNVILSTVNKMPVAYGAASMILSRQYSVPDMSGSDANIKFWESFLPEIFPS